MEIAEYDFKSSIVFVWFLLDLIIYQLISQAKWNILEVLKQFLSKIFANDELIIWETFSLDLFSILANTIIWLIDWLIDRF